MDNLAKTSKKLIIVFLIMFLFASAMSGALPFNPFFAFFICALFSGVFGSRIIFRNTTRVLSRKNKIIIYFVVTICGFAFILICYFLLILFMFVIPYHLFDHRG